MSLGRIVAQHKTNYRLRADNREYLATVRGSFFTTEDFPCVGDYVRYTALNEDQAVIEELLPRTSVITRKAAHTDAVQTIVANVDLIFIVMGVDGDFNLSRLERYLFLATQHGIKAVVLLNKIDMTESPKEYLHQAQTIAPDALIHLVSALSGVGMQAVRHYFTSETTAVLLGSSGAGKSTITNWLLGNETQATSGIREDDSHGRHTTTARELFALPDGGYLIDTPGMRELGVVGESLTGEDRVFSKIETLAENCKFANCDHERSAGCAILSALETGKISQREYQSYQKLKRESAYMESKADEESALDYKHKKKKLHQSYTQVQKRKRMEQGE